MSLIRPPSIFATAPGFKTFCLMAISNRANGDSEVFSPLEVFLAASKIAEIITLRLSAGPVNCDGIIVSILHPVLLLVKKL